eukprot:907499-Prymnesium_polylepis.1
MGPPYAYTLRPTHSESSEPSIAPTTIAAGRHPRAPTGPARTRGRLGYNIEHAVDVIVASTVACIASCACVPRSTTLRCPRRAPAGS